MYRCILVPIDGSPCARAGLDHALRLAQDCRATLRLLYVIDKTTAVASEEIGPQAREAILGALRIHGRSVLDHALMQAREMTLVAEGALVEVSSGRVADAIVKAAHDAACDLIVMGSHGRRGISRLMLGSDTELVLRAGAVPVLVVPGGEG